MTRAGNLVLCLTLSSPFAGAQFRTGYHWGTAPAPLSSMNYAAFTHIVHSYVEPSVSGSTVSLNTTTMDITLHAAELIATAHASKVQVLLGVSGSPANIASASDDAHLAAFVGQLMTLVETYGYDGVDLDWEGSPDQTQFTNLIAALRAAINAYHPPSGGAAALTAFFGPAANAAATYAQLDQVNVACYDDMNNEFPVIWHNAALADPAKVSGGQTCPQVLRYFTAAGVPKAKLGVGIPFYGYVVSGGRDASGAGPYRPGQIMQVAPTSVDYTEYRDLVANPQLWQIAYQKVDVGAGNVPYLSIDKGANGNVFVTYDDAVSITTKWNWAMANGYGGVEVWTIGADYIAGGSSVATMHPLAEALRLAAHASKPATPRHKVSAAREP